MNYFENTDTLYDITEKYPETIDIFAANGFSQLKDDNKRKMLGKAITFSQAMKSKKKNEEIFKEMLFEVITQNRKSSEEGISEEPAEVACDIAGVLPCPVKIPLLDSFAEFSDDYVKKHGKGIRYRLKSASGGVSWLEDEVSKAQDAHGIPDLFISAGFELFFDKKLIGHFRDEGVFKDMSGLKEFNSSFEGLDLRDKKGYYSILSTVPAVFLVNTDELNGRKSPETWDDLLSEEFENSLSLPVEDLDLFNAVILTLYKNRGEEAVRRLGRNLMSSMHPAQMVKSGKKKDDKPVVTVLPWFFTKMVFPGTALEVVWPKDGAIISPVFLAGKKSKEKEIKDIVDFFESEKVGSLLRERGYFPSVNPEVDNKIPEGCSFQWVGWDYIYSHDVGAIIRECTDIFNREAGI